jgi:hypothetical protein
MVLYNADKLSREPESSLILALGPIVRIFVPSDKSVCLSFALRNRKRKKKTTTTQGFVKFLSIKTKYGAFFLTYNTIIFILKEINRKKKDNHRIGTFLGCDLKHAARSLFPDGRL